MALYAILFYVSRHCFVNRLQNNIEICLLYHTYSFLYNILPVPDVLHCLHIHQDICCISRFSENKKTARFSLAAFLIPCYMPNGIFHKSWIFQFYACVPQHVISTTDSTCKEASINMNVWRKSPLV